MRKIISTVFKNEYKTLYLCDDSRGTTYLICKKLGLSKKVTGNIIFNLIKKGLIVPSEHLDEWGDKWYHSTEKGKNFLKIYAKRLNLEEDF